MNTEIIDQKYIDGVLHTLCGCGTCGRWFVAHKNEGNGKEIRHIKGHYCIGKKHSEATREKNRQWHIGRTPWNQGKTGIYSEETLKKIKDARARQVMIPGRRHSEESKEKNRIAHLGKSHTEESKLKTSISNTGKKRSDEQKEKYSISKTGANNPGWRGGISKLPYTQNWTEDLKDAVRKRDNYTCQICRILQDDLNDRFHKKLPVHHIDYDKNNCDPENLISLCVSCHMKTNRKRDKWTVYFNKNKKQSTLAMVVNE